MIYFAFGASGFINITDSFFLKDRLQISAHTILTLGVWLSLPWTIKMLFGQCVDSLPIWGSTRRVYIFIAAFLMALGSLLLAALAGHWSSLSTFAKPVSIYFIAKIITVIAIVLQDVVADAMSVEVVPREGRSEKDIHKDLAMVQVLGRLSLAAAMFIVAGLGGWLAHYYSYETMYLLTLIIPVISVSGCLMVKLDKTITTPVDLKILLGGIGFGFFCITDGTTAYTLQSRNYIFYQFIFYCILFNASDKRLRRVCKKENFCRQCSDFYFQSHAECRAWLNVVAN